MHILHISTIREWRGGDAQMLTTYQLMKDFNHVQQTILCPTGSVLSEKCKAQHINYYTASRESKQSIPFLKKIKEVIQKEKIDIVHVHDSNAFSLTLLVLRLFPKVKLIYSRKRNNRISKNFFKKVKYNHKRINKIVCVSNAVRDVFKGVVKDMNKVVTIYDGINIDAFTNIPHNNELRKTMLIPEDTKICCNIAGLTPQKDLYTFIDAAEIILKKSSEKIKFVIAGDGELKSELQEYTKTKNLSEDILFLGFRTDIPEILAEADYLLMSSENEGLPLTIYEAFASKTPVITTNAGGIAEAVIQKETGFISPIKNAEKLADNFLLCTTNTKLTSTIIENAAEIVREKFSSDVMKKEYLKLYESVFKQ